MREWTSANALRQDLSLVALTETPWALPATLLQARRDANNLFLCCFYARACTLVRAHRGKGWSVRLRRVAASGRADPD
jgi:hypothetical protein